MTTEQNTSHLGADLKEPLLLRIVEFAHGCGMNDTAIIKRGVLLVGKELGAVPKETMVITREGLVEAVPVAVTSSR